MNIQLIKNKSKQYRTNRQTIVKRPKIRSFVTIVVCSIYLIGTLVGATYFKHVIEGDFFEENPNILNNIDVSNEMDTKSLFEEILSRNLVIIVFMWIIGLSILGVPILIFFVLYDGFSLGITVFYVLNTFGFYKGYEFLYSRMYLVTILNTGVIVFLCNSAMKATANILRQKTSVKSEFIRHSSVCIIMLLILIISSVVETCLNLK